MLNNDETSANDRKRAREHTTPFNSLFDRTVRERPFLLFSSLTLSLLCLMMMMMMENFMCMTVVRADVCITFSLFFSLLYTNEKKIKFFLLKKKKERKKELLLLANEN